eukprot:TRINITY_DN10776_c0_g1_i11.p1 TRINITY_DN10776_c0_g1~~TRINITY_DN10776_c0_g1_i11.p1  ORF type:complete len:109 (+),score=17.49 TRINITY_DN10776_c0_g1_i11:135-461(+)
MKTSPSGETKLSDIQLQLDSFPLQEDLAEKEKEAVSSYKKILWHHYLLNRQRAKIKWLREGDLNSTYCHACIKQKHHVSAIGALYDSNGKLLVNQQDIKQNIIEFFQG